MMDGERNVYGLLISSIIKYCTVLNSDARDIQKSIIQMY